jgi:hypothetical protein
LWGLWQADETGKWWSIWVTGYILTSWIIKAPGP